MGSAVHQVTPACGGHSTQTLSGSMGWSINLPHLLCWQHTHTNPHKSLRTKENSPTSSLTLFYNSLGTDSACKTSRFVPAHSCGSRSCWVCCWCSYQCNSFLHHRHLLPRVPGAVCCRPPADDQCGAVVCLSTRCSAGLVVAVSGLLVHAAANANLATSNS